MYIIFFNSEKLNLLVAILKLRFFYVIIKSKHVPLLWHKIKMKVILNDNSVRGRLLRILRNICEHYNLSEI